MLRTPVRLTAESNQTMAPFIAVPLASLFVGFSLLAAHGLLSKNWKKTTALVQSWKSLDSDWDQAIVRYKSVNGDAEAQLIVPSQFRLATKVGTSITVLVHPHESTKVRLPNSGTVLKVLGIFATAFGIIGLVFAALMSHS